MQTPREHFYQSNFYRILCTKIEEKAQCTVRNFKESETVAARIRAEGFSISAHTLARFFGILPQRKMYPATLDILANYVGFQSLNQFVSFEKKWIEREITSSNPLFSGQPFSLISLELAIELNDSPRICEMLEAIDMYHPDKEKATLLLGRLVRESTMQQELLKTLISVENGRRLFFESYVDEDDFNGYFSNALQQHYLKQVNTINNQLFGYCFLISKAIYTKRSIQALLPEFERLKNNCENYQLHFHELSRLIETQILLDGQANILKKTYHQHIEQCLQLQPSLDYHAFAWLVARPIKALAFNGMLKQSLQITSFKQALLNCYRAANIETIAELIIQLVVTAYFNHSDDLAFHPPLNLHPYAHPNEKNARIVIEAATQSLILPKTIQPQLNNNIHLFAKRTGQTWVFELLD